MLSTFFFNSYAAKKSSVFEDTNILSAQKCSKVLKSAQSSKLPNSPGNDWKWMELGQKLAIWSFTGLGTFEHFWALKILVPSKTENFLAAKPLKKKSAQHFFNTFNIMFKAWKSAAHFFSSIYLLLKMLSF